MKSFLLLFLVGISMAVSAQTTTFSNDTTLANGINITGNIAISATGRLRIAPGAAVTCTGTVTNNVGGKMYVNAGATFGCRGITNNDSIYVAATAMLSDTGAFTNNNGGKLALNANSTLSCKGLNNADTITIPATATIADTGYFTNNSPGRLIVGNGASFYCNGGLTNSSGAKIYFNNGALVSGILTGVNNADSMYIGSNVTLKAQGSISVFNNNSGGRLIVNGGTVTVGGSINGFNNNSGGRVYLMNRAQLSGGSSLYGFQNSDTVLVDNSSLVVPSDNLNNYNGGRLILMHNSNATVINNYYGNVGGMVFLYSGSTITCGGVSNADTFYVGSGCTSVTTGSFTNNSTGKVFLGTNAGASLTAQNISNYDSIFIAAGATITCSGNINQYAGGYIGFFSGTDDTYVTCTSLNNNGSSTGNHPSYIGIPAGQSVVLKGNLANAYDTLYNAGHLFVSGNITNNTGSYTAYGGTLHLNGSTAQTFSGNAKFYTGNIEINNPAGITISDTVQAGNTVTFTNGIVNTPSAATNGNVLIFDTAAAAVNVSDASHVNGYVQKMGTGSFTYPTGDASRYQPVTLNLGSNAGGMKTAYKAADAGSAPFITPLQAYNTLEYWDLVPVSTASGTVTIYWDSYNGMNTSDLTSLVVAHKTGGQWQSEGILNTATGTAASGSVTSGNVSTWSPFTLGIAGVSLPLTLISFNGNRNNGNDYLNWKTAQEFNMSHFEVAYSAEGTTFETIGIVAATNSTVQTSYSYTHQSVTGSAFYRLKMVNNDGTFAYSNTVFLNGGNAGATAINAVYPVPFRNGLHLRITSDKNQQAQAILVNAAGQTVRSISINLSKGTNEYAMSDLSTLANSVYYLKIITADGTNMVYKVSK